MCLDFYYVFIQQCCKATNQRLHGDIKTFQQNNVISETVEVFPRNLEIIANITGQEN